MTLQGVVKNGLIVLDQPYALPEGAVVRVEIVEPAAMRSGEGRTLLDRLQGVFGAVDDLPEDGARNLGHYLSVRPS